MKMLMQLFKLNGINYSLAFILSIGFWILSLNVLVIAQNQKPFMIKDIFSSPSNSLSSNPQFGTLMNGIKYFSANDGIHGVELWRTDDTKLGTYMVKDIKAGLLGSNPNNFVTYGNLILFMADDGVNGLELWRSDGTEAGTYMLKDIQSPGNSIPSQFVLLNGLVFFSAATLTSGYELWKTDGTSSGTIMVKDIWIGSNSSNISQLLFLNNVLYFTANDGTNGVELWKSDGTESGTVLLKNINTSSGSSSNPSNFTILGSHLYFTANDGVNGEELWRTDGTSSGTTLIADVRAGAISSTPSKLTAIADQLFFRANDGIAGLELWKYNSTLSVFSMVKDINPGPANSNLDNLIELNGALMFSAFDGMQGPELWKSDGTTAGTNLLKDIRGGSPSSSNLAIFTIANGLLFFRADDGMNGIELWKSDGSTMGTQLVKDIWPGMTGSNVLGFKVLNNQLYFTANDGSFGAELWKTDGSVAGTLLVKDINSGSGNAAPGNLTKGNGIVFFSANDGINGSELWKSDGSAAGTSMVKDIRNGFGGSILSGNQGQFAFFDGILYFRADDGVSGLELWRSDGTNSGTYLLKDINAGPSGSNFYGFTKYNGSYYFFANDGANGHELWKSDGTAGGTTIVKDINPGSPSSAGSNILILNGSMYFFAITATHGVELWKSDGTSAGTILVKDLNPGANGSWYSAGNFFTVYNDQLFFIADDGVNGIELWKSDGTSTGTVLVHDINPGAGSSNPNTSSFGVHNGILYFNADNGSTGVELWRTNGNSGGTYMVKDIYPGTMSSIPQNFISFNSNVYFAADDGLNGRKLWKSDGTSGGTQMVADVGAGSFVVSNGSLFFSGVNSNHGLELWTTNGEAGGTHILKDITKGTLGSNIANFLDVDGTLYFTASHSNPDNFQYGTELWRLGNCIPENDLVTVSGKSFSFNEEIQNTSTVICFCDVLNNLISRVDSTGGDPFILPADVKVWNQNTNALSYVKRHFEITPDENPSTKEGIVTLYFTQAEFDAYNSKTPLPATILPTHPNDLDGISNIRIEKKPGKSSDGSGLPQTYAGAVSTIDPDDGNIIWNVDENRWEVSFATVGFSGFWLKSFPCPLLNTAPPNVSITNSYCSGCNVVGGNITAPPGTPCPPGSVIEYQENGGNWTTTLPIYKKNGPPQTIKTRCSCTEMPTFNSPESSGNTTAPGSCPQCPPPIQVYHTNLTPYSAKILWVPGGSSCITTYQLRIKYQLPNGTWSSWSAWVNKNTGGNQHQYLGLTPNTFYQYQVRSKCGSQSKSTPITNWFSTPPDNGPADSEVQTNRITKSLDGENSMISESNRVDQGYQINIIPNPNQGIFRLNIIGDFDSIYQITIRNMFGHLLWEQKNVQATKQLDINLENFIPGIYSISVQNGKHFLTKQFVVQETK